MIAWSAEYPTKPVFVSLNFSKDIIFVDTPCSAFVNGTATDR